MSLSKHFRPDCAIKHIPSFFNLKISFSVILLLGVFACQTSPEERYLEHRKTELARKDRKNSLFMGFYFGMPKKQFREYCYDKNIEGRFKQGGRKSSVWVESALEGLEYPAAINFYPNFTNDSIREMRASIYYENAVFKDGVFERDSLLLDVLNLMDHWYGGTTFEIKSPLFYKEDVYVKLQANRRITIYPDATGQAINLWFVDMSSILKEKLAP